MTFFIIHLYHSALIFPRVALCLPSFLSCRIIHQPPCVKVALKLFYISTALCHFTRVNKLKQTPVKKNI